jgi:hypothetical protein
LALVGVRTPQKNHTRPPTKPQIKIKQKPHQNMASNQTNSYGKSLEEIKAEARRYALANTRMIRAPYSPTFLAPPATTAAAAPDWSHLPKSLQPKATTAATSKQQQQQQQRPVICIDDEEYLRFVLGLNDNTNSNSSSSIGKKDPLVDQLLTGEDDDDEFLLDPLLDDDEEDLDDEDEEEEDDDDDDIDFNKRNDPANNSSFLPMKNYGSPSHGKKRSTKQRNATGRGSAKGTTSAFDDVDMD